MRVHRVPFSTNVERVALAAGYKGLTVDWVDHDPADRRALRALSGQDLVPVMETGDGEVIVESMAILERIEADHPDQPLYPPASARRAELDVFVEWFNGIWKVAPNSIEAEERAVAPDAARISAWAAALGASLGAFEALLDGRPFLFGDAFSAADACAFPFLKYATRHDPADDERFHAILAEHLALGDGFPFVRAWIDRVDALPRA